ncbi:MAG: glycoside hydrolase family 78 protein [Bacteroidales bacterium]|nr:glycoside hydrolase family 78 protein [Bacteroidales bacterium]
MKSFKLSLLFLSLAAALSAQDLMVSDLTTEYKKNPLGIDVLQPRLSWKISGTGNDIMQTAYSIRVATDPKFLAKNTVWTSGKVNSPESIHVPYNGSALKSGERYYWQVRTWDNKNRQSKWSETAYWETGLMTQPDWKAKWIEMPGDTNRYSPSPHFRKEFSVEKNITKAVVYVTSHGWYELHINGKKVGDEVLTPGWTSYGKRLQYQVYDVTGQVVKGKNAVGAVLGDGWFRSTLGWGSNWAIYGKKLGLLMQLRIKYSDGTESLIITDGTWKCNNNGAIRMSDVYNGETYDATRKLTGWNLPGFDEKGWQIVNTAEYKFNLVASEGAPIRKIEEIRPVKVFRSPKGSLLVDMGQNMVGWVRLTVTGPRGTTVKIRHAEFLDKYGEFYTANLRSAKCELNYTLAGTGEEVYEPRFTFMGFRYLEVTGFPGTLTPANIMGIVVHSDMKPTGTWESSNKMLNQLQHNIRWGQKGNFVDVPTDCPQRDERLGWTGDAQAFCRTAAFNFDVTSFFTKWLKDVALDQKQGGEIPDVIPDVLNRQDATSAAPSAGWGDVGVIVPWTMYTVYGDRRLLETQYPSMKKWVEYIRGKAGDSQQWKGGSKYGDWLFYHPPVNSHTAADGFTERDFIATAYYAYSASLLAEAAKVLGKTEDEKFYTDLFKKIKEVFIREYVTPAGRVGTCSQTSYVLALKFNLLPDNLRKAAAEFLVADIKGRGNHLSTGFLGTIYLNHVLSAEGHSDVAYDLLLQETYPSWIYPVKMGATTIWERWDGQKTDSTFQDAGMNSFNHYAYGAIGDWMYRVSAGIEALAPGYREILIQPVPSKKLSFSKASYESLYGTISSGWERKNGKLAFTVKIPANTKATIKLPADNVSKVTENGLPVREGEGAFILAADGVKSAMLIRGSGDYVFEISE